MCLKQISSLFTTKSHKESLSPTFLFLALVATPSPEDDVILCVFLRVFSLIIIHNKELFLRKIFEFSLHKTNFLVAHKPAETKKKTRRRVRKTMTVICIGGCCVPLESLLPVLLLSLSKFGKKLMHFVWEKLPIVEKVPLIGSKFVPPMELAKRRKKERNEEKES